MSPEFTQNGGKNKNHPVSGGSVGVNSLLKSKVRRDLNMSKREVDGLQ